jgi:group I intron endonuclease
VPIQKSSKFNNILLKNGVYTSKHTYSTLSHNSLKNDDINYVKFYENVFDMKKDILNENKGKSGIYMLTNKIAKKIYIGQSKDLSNRFKNYLNLSYLKSQPSLTINRALVKYGYSNFSLTILEYCEISELLTREQFYFDKLKPQYNILKIAGSSPNSKHSEYTKARISKSLKGIDEKENLMKQKALGRKHSEDTKLKKSAISGNPVNIYEKYSSSGFKFIGSFVSARRAGKFLGISGNTVIKYKNSGEIFKDRYKFSSKQNLENFE